MTELPPCVFPLVVKEGAKEALLCIHPGGLPSRNYRLLAEAVPDASIYVAELSMNMRYVEAAQETVPAEGVIGELAGDVRAAFDAVSQGERILVLCGWSFGGVIAHEIALRMAGEDGAEPLLLVLDSIAPVRSYRFDRIASTLSAKGLAESAGRQVNIATWFVAYLNSLKGASIRLSRREAARMEPDTLRATLLARSIAAGAFPPGTSEAGFGKVFQEFRRGMTRNTRLLAGYAPQGPKRDVLLVRAATPFFPVFRVFRKMGWDALARRVTTLTVRGDHYQLLAREEPMRRVALFLKAHLRRPPAAEASPGGSAPFQPTTRENSNV